MKDGNNNQDHYKYIYNSIEKIQLENKLINSKMDNVREEVMRSIFFKKVEDDSLEIMPDKIKKEIEISLEKIGNGNCSVVVFYMENMQLVALVGVKEHIKRSSLLNDIEGVKDGLPAIAITKILEINLFFIKKPPLFW